MKTATGQSEGLQSRKQRTARLQKLGLALPDILLPAYEPEQRDDWQKWAVIACDQYTSEPKYWQELRRRIGNAPSVLQAILPEAEMAKEDAQLQEQIRQVRQGMKKLDQSSLLQALSRHPAARGKQVSFVLVCRTMASGRQQWGIVLAVDLEHYQFERFLQEQAIVQPTEKTVLERLPVRRAVRTEAPLDFSHILLLYDDCAGQLFAPLIDLARQGQLALAYDFPLCRMPNFAELSSAPSDFAVKQHNIHGSVRGYLLPDSLIDHIFLPALEQNQGRPMFLVGDGNHSLAAAKQVWEAAKAQAGSQVMNDDPRRYTLAELINFADSELLFEPIHRLVFFSGKGGDRQAAAIGQMPISQVPSSQVLVKNHAAAHWLWKFLQILEKETQHEVLISELPEFEGMELHQGPEQSPLETCLRPSPTEDRYRYFFLFACEGRLFRVEGRSSQEKETVRVVQQALDSLDQSGWSLDYVHGAERCLNLARRTQPGQGSVAAILLPYLRRDSFFSEQAQHKVLPRKSFSIGHSEEKRFYIECRKLV